MSIAKVINGPNRGRSKLEDIHGYITDTVKTDKHSLVGGYAGGRSLESMLIVDRLYHQEKGRQFFHVVIAPTRAGYIEPKQYLEFAGYISQLYPEYQSFYAVHTDTEHLHVHIVFNTVNFKTGKKFSMSKSELNRFKQRCNDFLDSFGFETITDNANCIWDQHDYARISGFDFLEIDECLLPPKKRLPDIDIFSDTVNVEPFYNPDYPTGRCDCSRFFYNQNEYFPTMNWRSRSMKIATVPTPDMSNFTPSVPTTEPMMQNASLSVPTIPNAYPTMSLDIGPHLDITANSGDDLSNLIPMVEGVFQEAQRQQQAAVNMGYAVAKKAAGDELPLNIHVNAAPHIHIDFTCDPVESIQIETSMNDIEDE